MALEDDGVNREVLVRRASMNSHNWIGGISTLDYKAGNFRYSLGIDLRNMWVTTTECLKT